MSGLVRAAGGVVHRSGSELEILLVHRPKYDDWSLPKGKAEPGEEDEDTALREVEEETGLRCALGADLGEITYVDHLGRDKVVRYWAMTPVGGVLQERDGETDEVVWVPAAEALARLSYDRDRDVLLRFWPGGR